MRIRLSIGWLLCLLTGFTITARATHIVGGEVTYKCLGGNNYAITLVIYEDCLTGLPEAIAEDDPAYISIFDDNNTLFEFDSMRLAKKRETVPANFSNSCINNPPPTCLFKATFTKTYNLPNATTGYTVVYQRCCRNGGVRNLINPADIGATYYCTIPSASQAACNNSAVFKNFPPQIICINNPLVYDHSATDPDGDSLSYEFCQDYQGGSGNDVKPTPTPPPFTPVQYNGPFSFANPMGGYPQIQIDPKTGIITGTPNLIGRFSVAVCCHEWRNHVMINTVTREFQFVVTDCSKAVVADIPQLSTEYNTYLVDCKGYTVTFVNQSKGAFSYYWDFGDTSDRSDTSSAFEPTHTYTDTGVYNVKLVVNRGTTCTDSITRLVKLYPYFATDYEDNGLQCPNSIINFTDLTTSTYKPINNWEWTFGDGTSSSDENTSHAYRQGGTYNVQLISQNIKGCIDTMLRQVLIENFIPFAGNDTIIVKGESIDFNASGGVQYTWSPANNLSDPNINNPVGYYPDTGHYNYNVHITSPFGCVGDDSIRVYVVGQGALFVPTGFTPNGDGRDDYFKPIVIGYRQVKFFDIYNRWGQQVFHTNQIEAGWDGTFNGKPVDTDVYFWTLDIVDRNGNEVKQKGDVTLIR